jgi:DNA-binding NarL/FixJ family response regulator
MVMEKIKILIADDHQLIREGIEAMVLGTPDMEVVGLVNSGEAAINVARLQKPDVVLLDIVMPAMNGIEAARWIKEMDKSIRIILITMEISKAFVSEGIKAGVDGYLPKDISKRILMDAIRTVYKGERYFNDAIKKLVFEEFYAAEKTRGPQKSLPDDLTKREVEVLALVASGKSNKQTAELLFISVKTVETHKANILAKLGLNNSTELVRYAIKNKIISMD